MKESKGFTLIELLVVVSIIGVLATLIMPSLSEVRKKAQVVKAVTELKHIEKAFFRAAIDEGLNDYWTTAELGSSNSYIYICDILAIDAPNPGHTIKKYINNCDFSFDWQYRNLETVSSQCGTSGGVKLYFDFFSRKLGNDGIEEINRLIDGEENNTNCGKISRSGVWNFYYLSRDPSKIEF